MAIVARFHCYYNYITRTYINSASQACMIINLLYTYIIYVSACIIINQQLIADEHLDHIT